MVENILDARKTSGWAPRWVLSLVLGIVFLATLGGLRFFQTQNAAPALGGAIAPEKGVWLFTAVALWFFITPLLAWQGRLLPAVARSLRVFSLGMWLRGILELYMLYGSKTWSPTLGIAHDLLMVVALWMTVFWPRGSSSSTPSESENTVAHAPARLFSTSQLSWGLLGVLTLSLLVEAHHAALFLQVVQERTQGDQAIWFASEANPVFQEILFRTRIGNVVVLGAFGAWLIAWALPVSRSRALHAWRAYQKHDPRYWIAAAQLTYIILGFTVLGFNRTPYQVALLSTTACTFEVFLHRVLRGRWILPLSALITSFGLSLLLNYSHDYWLIFVPVFFAIGSKYVITFKGRHYLNPALAGVYFSLLLGEGFISSAPAYQWRGLSAMAVFIGMFGLLFLLPRINRHFMVGAFFLTFTAQTALRALIMRHHLPFETLFFGTITTPAFFLFTFFMITDPATSPSTRRGQVAFGVLLGLLDLAFHLKQSYGTFFKSLFWLSMARWALAHFQEWRTRKGSPLSYAFQAFFGERYYLRPAFLGVIALSSVLLYRSGLHPRLAQENLDWKLSEIQGSQSGIQARLGDALERLDPRVHHMGKWLLSVGDSVATGDVDGDMRPDLFLTQPLKETQKRAVLYVNRTPAPGAPFEFQEVSIPALEARSRSIERTGLATNGMFVDFDNDGDKDLFVTYAFGAPLLLKSLLVDSGELRFEDVTAQSGLNFYTNSIAANFADFNNDGRLDLILGNVWPKNLPDYPNPTPLNLFRLPQPEYAGDIRMFNFMHESWNLANNGGELELFLQEANGHFQKQDSLALGFKETRWTLAIGTGDLNQDGWTDFYVANDFGPDQLFLNQGAARQFQDVKGPFFGTVGRDTYKGMNATVADFDRNGWLDVYVSNVHHVLQAEGSLLWMFGPPAETSRHAPAAGVATPTIEDRATELGALNENRFGWGAAAADLDNDGWLDLVQANGMVDDTIDRRFEKCPDFWYTNERIALSPPSIHRYIHNWGDIRGRCIYGKEQDRVYLNRGMARGQTFIDVADRVGLSTLGTSRGVAAADFDGDGRMDLAISHPFKPTTLHQNTLKEKRQVAPLRSWIGLTLQGDGVQCNRDAVGSRVQLGAQVREVQTVNGFSGQSDPSLHFGLASERLEGGRVTVKVRWCGQWEEEYRGLAVNRKHSLQMGRSSLSQSKVRE